MQVPDPTLLLAASGTASSRKPPAKGGSFEMSVDRVPPELDPKDERLLEEDYSDKTDVKRSMR